MYLELGTVENGVLDASEGGTHVVDAAALDVDGRNDIRDETASGSRMITEASRTYRVPSP